MDPDPPSPNPRKVKFAPKGPPRGKSKPIAAKIEAAVDDDDDGDDDEAQRALSRKVNEHLTRRRPKTEKKSSVQVAFSHGAASTAIRTFGKQKERTDDRGDSTASSKETRDDMLVDSKSIVETGVVENSTDSSNALIVKKKKSEYKEPWDYQHSYYPTTLPLRRPYSGNPELLDKAEFEKALEYDEKSLSSASDLGLLDQDDTPRMLFFQLPSNLPVSSSRPSRVSSTTSKGKEIAGSSSRSSKGKEIAGSSINPVSGHPLRKGSSLEALPEGYMGKMLVYKSGAVKLKLGDVLYDVSPGSDCIFSQSVMAINTANKHCCELGELNKRAVVSPDIDYLIDNVIELG